MSTDIVVRLARRHEIEGDRAVAAAAVARRRAAREQEHPPRGVKIAKIVLRESINLSMLSVVIL